MINNLSDQDWLNDSGPEKDVILSSRIRLARNFNDFKFPNQSSKDEKDALLSEMCSKLDFLAADYKFTLMEELTENERNILQEEHLISKEHLLSPAGKALFLNNDQHISLMVNEEDHLRIQILHAGLSFEHLWEIIDQLDDQIDARLQYAFSEKWGYLTSCPTNVGTGIRVSAMCHLPALSISGRIDNILGTVGKFGLTVRGVYGEGSGSVGEIFQISNQITLGHSEHEIIENLTAIIIQIINEERKSREYLVRNNFLELKDNVNRSYGILKYAYQLSETEALKYLSRVKFGLDCNLLAEKLDNNFFSELLFKIRPAHLNYNNDLNQNNFNKKRAELIRNKL